MNRKLIPAFLAAIPFLAVAADDSLDAIVVTAPRMKDPLTVVTDPKAPRQPLPAHDGGDYLKSIPGFSLIRKGGADGDPVFRGMAGSRLNILVDGENILGGCNFRMDAPTAYIFPEVYDKLTLVKGPQSVLHGAGNSAGTVMFERVVKPFEVQGTRINASLTAGSFGRHDELADVRVGGPGMYGQATVTNSTSGDFKDGAGRAVHSRYRRWSANGALGLTPDKDTRIELHGTRSDGYAAYADRGMDGTKFLRNSVGIKFEKARVSKVVEKLEASLFKNEVDHVMDDQNLRTPGTMGYANLKRDTAGGRFSATLWPTESTRVALGADFQRNGHDSRSAGANAAYGAWREDAAFREWGVFGEATFFLTEHRRVVGGLRADRWTAEDKRATVQVSMMGSVANPTAGQTRSDTLASGFLRMEQAAGGATWYAGLGRSERAPDYWELISKEGTTTASAFADTRTEKTTQIDIGVVHKSGPWNASLSAFANRIDDFILIQSNMAARGAGMTARNPTVTRNVDAHSHGTEAGLGYRLSDTWALDGALAYVHGSNRTDGTALAQLPPLELRLGANYDNKVWSFGALLRGVAAQTRFDLNKGNIVGQDLGATPGFAIFSVNGGWRPRKGTLLTAGIDNLFNKTYAEFVSRAGGNGMGGAIPGYVQTTRVNEPGRTAWLKAQIAID
ncbi:MAG: TonB-dependent copper receptor [Burkholderiales bacterium]|nr:TonB-dependent copper receptor [Burkholderiales bacterium]